MKTFFTWVGIIAFFSGVIFLAWFAVNDCDNRGGHMINHGKYETCSK